MLLPLLGASQPGGSIQLHQAANCTGLYPREDRGGTFKDVPWEVEQNKPSLPPRQWPRRLTAVEGIPFLPVAGGKLCHPAVMPFV